MTFHLDPSWVLESLCARVGSQLIECKTSRQSRLEQPVCSQTPDALIERTCPDKLGHTFHVNRQVTLNG